MSVGLAPAAACAADERIGRLEELYACLERLEDPQARELVRKIAATLLELHADGLARLVAAILDTEPQRGPLRRKLVEDPVVAGLLLVHDLYPVDLETRVGRALERARPRAESCGGSLRLLGLRSGVARVRVAGRPARRPEVLAALERHLREALAVEAPDLVELELELEPERVPPARPTPTPPLPVGGEPRHAGPTAHEGRRDVPAAGRATQPWHQWLELPAAAGLGRDECRLVRAAGTSLLVVDDGGRLLAFHGECTRCGRLLTRPALDGHVLRCRGCGEPFDLRRRGRSLLDASVGLRPVPLVTRAGVPRVALAR